MSSKVALNRVKQDGNPSETEFKRISYDGQTSIVKCQSLTDRPHQIRVHLQYIGYPIANDTIYSNEWVWGPSLGKDGNGDDIEIEQKLEQIGRTVPASSFINPLQVTQDTLIEGKRIIPQTFIWNLTPTIQISGFTISAHLKLMLKTHSLSKYPSQNGHSNLILNTWKWQWMKLASVRELKSHFQLAQSWSKTTKSYRQAFPGNCLEIHTPNNVHLKSTLQNTM